MAASGEVDLEHQLSDEYGLSLCRVVTDLHQDELPLAALGVAGAAFLAAEIGRKKQMVIGIGYGRTLEASAEALPEEPAPHIRLVSLMGSLTRRSSANPHEVIDRLAQRIGAQAFVMPVPFMANTLSDRQVLLSQHGIADAFDLAGGSDLMVVGIGTTDPDASLVIGGMIEPAEIDELRRAGAAGEMLGHFFNARRQPGRDRAHPSHHHAAVRAAAQPPHRRHCRRGDEGRRDPRGAGERPAHRPDHRRADGARHRRHRP